MSEKFGDYDWLEALTGIKKQTLYAMVHERRIPHVRLSPRLVRFREADILAWLEKNAIAVKDTRVVTPGGKKAGAR